MRFGILIVDDHLGQLARQARSLQTEGESILLLDADSLIAEPRIIRTNRKFFSRIVVVGDSHPNAPSTEQLSKAIGTEVVPWQEGDTYSSESLLVSRTNLTSYFVNERSKDRSLIWFCLYPAPRPEPKIVDVALFDLSLSPGGHDDLGKEIAVEHRQLPHSCDVRYGIYSARLGLQDWVTKFASFFDFAIKKEVMEGADYVDAVKRVIAFGKESTDDSDRTTALGSSLVKAVTHTCEEGTTAWAIGDGRNYPTGVKLGREAAAASWWNKTLPDFLVFFDNRLRKCLRPSEIPAWDAAVNRFSKTMAISATSSTADLLEVATLFRKAYDEMRVVLGNILDNAMPDSNKAGDIPEPAWSNRFIFGGADGAFLGSPLRQIAARMKGSWTWSVREIDRKVWVIVLQPPLTEDFLGGRAFLSGVSAFEFISREWPEMKTLSECFSRVYFQVSMADRFETVMLRDSAVKIAGDQEIPHSLRQRLPQGTLRILFQG